MSDDRPSVLIVYTGGTIGSLPIDPGNPDSPLDAVAFEKSLSNPACAGMAERMSSVDGGVNIKIESLEPAIDSSAIKPRDWIRIAKTIGDNYAKFDGFVVLHGTDTMANTAAALAFMFETLDKPIVLTGSQEPLFKAPTDARANLLYAIWVASRRQQEDIIPEVVILFGRYVIRGCRAVKYSATEADAFRSFNADPLGVIEPGRVHIHRTRKLPPRPVGKDGPSILYEMYKPKNLENRVTKIELSPETDAKEIEDHLDIPSTKGVILSTYGVGNAPSDEVLYERLRKAEREKCLVVNVTQCLNGRVQMGRYAASSELLEHGVVSGVDMTDQAARAKLYWAMVKGTSFVERQMEMQISQRGEQSEDLFDLRFRGTKEWRDDEETECDVCGAGVVRAIVSVPLPRLFKKVNLSQAILRCSGLEFIPEDGDKLPPDARMYVHLNHTSISRDEAQQETRKLLTEIRRKHVDGEQRFVREVTETAKPIIQPSDQYVRLTLTTSPGCAVICRSLFLAFFADPLIQ